MKWKKGGQQADGYIGELLRTAVPEGQAAPSKRPPVGSYRCRLLCGWGGSTSKTALGKKGNLAKEPASHASGVQTT